jgi:hypothetical protein
VKTKRNTYSAVKTNANRCFILFRQVFFFREEPVFLHRFPNTFARAHWLEKVVQTLYQDRDIDILVLEHLQNLTIGAVQIPDLGLQMY